MEVRNVHMCQCEQCTRVTRVTWVTWVKCTCVWTWVMCTWKWGKHAFQWLASFSTLSCTHACFNFLLHRQMSLAILAVSLRSREDNCFNYSKKVVWYPSLGSVCLNAARLEVSVSRTLSTMSGMCPLVTWMASWNEWKWMRWPHSWHEWHYERNGTEWMAS